MTDIFFWSVITLLGGGAALCAGFFWSSLREQRKRLDAEHQAWMAKERERMAEKAHAMETNVIRMSDADVSKRLSEKWRK